MAGLGATAACLARKRRGSRDRSKSPVRKDYGALTPVVSATTTVEALYDRVRGDRAECGVSRDETRCVLAELTNCEPAAVREDDLDIVRRRACNLRTSPPAPGRSLSGLAPAPVAAVAAAGAPECDAADAAVVDEREARLEKRALVEATLLYTNYLDHKGAVDALYAKHAKTRGGQLSPAQLRDALEALERKHGGHECFGISFSVIPSKRDVVDIIEKCDLDQDGFINRIELIPALQVWKKIADRHASAQTSVCAIM